MRYSLAMEQSVGRSSGALIFIAARARMRQVARSLEVVAQELRRIPSYHDEAERLREGLRRAQANSRGRDGADVSNA